MGNLFGGIRGYRWYQDLKGKVFDAISNLQYPAGYQHITLVGVAADLNHQNAGEELLALKQDALEAIRKQVAPLNIPQVGIQFKHVDVSNLYLELESKLESEAWIITSCPQEHFKTVRRRVGSNRDVHLCWSVAGERSKLDCNSCFSFRPQVKHLSKDVMREKRVEALSRTPRAYDTQQSLTTPSTSALSFGGAQNTSAAPRADDSKTKQMQRMHSSLQTETYHSACGYLLYPEDFVDTQQSPDKIHGRKYVEEIFRPGVEFSLHNECYRVQSKLGVGGYGVVLSVCVSGKPEDQMAAKILHSSAAESLVIELMVSLELRKHGAVFLPWLSDFGLATLEGALHDKFYVLIMEKARHTLSTSIQASSRMTLDEVLRNALILAHMLASLRSIGLVHQDVKPDNVLIDDDNYPLLADFGCSARFSSWNSRLKAGPNSSVPLVGHTPKYASPEVLIDQQKKVNDRADVWAWALVTTEMLSVPLPEQPSEVAKREEWNRTVVERLCMFEVPPGSPEVAGREKATETEKHLVPEFRNLLIDCLTPSPKQRPSIEQVKSALLDFQQSTKKETIAQWEDVRLKRRQRSCAEDHWRVELQAFEVLHTDQNVGQFCWRHLASIVDLQAIQRISPQTMLIQSVRQCLVSKPQAGQEILSPKYCASVFRQSLLKHPNALEACKSIKSIVFSSLEPTQARVNLLQMVAPHLDHLLAEPLVDISQSMEEKLKTGTERQYTVDRCFHAAQKGDVSELKGLLWKCPDCLSMKNEQGHNLAHVAARNGRLHVLEWLIDCNARVDIGDVFGCTPVHFAASYGHYKVLEMLRERQISLDVRTSAGFTPAHSAVLAGCGEKRVYEILEAQLLSRDVAGRTPQVLMEELSRTPEALQMLRVIQQKKRRMGTL